jgi:hypothetical protein
MNAWGHSRVDNALSSVNLVYEVEDRLELMGQESWVEDAIGGALRGDNSVMATLMGPATMALAASGVGDDIADLMGGERFGDGRLDEFIAQTYNDTNGADWFNTPYDPDNSESVDMLSESVLIRPTVHEQSDWDPDSPTHPIWWTANIARAPGSIKRHQVMYGQKIAINLDWTEIQARIPGITSVYVTAKFEASGQGLEAGRPVWRNETFSVNDPIIYDFNQTSGGLPLWISDDTGAVTPPKVTIWIYQNDPDSCTDFLSLIRNTIYMNVIQLRMEIDQEYLAKYFDILREQENQAWANKVGMVILGAAMIIVSPFTGGSSAVWGADLIVSSVTGKSMFDHISHGAMHFINSVSRTAGGENVYSEDYINSFQFMHFSSDVGTNLLLTELIADVMGAGIAKMGGKVFGKIAGALENHFERLGRVSSIIKKIQKFTKGGTSFTASIDKILSMSKIEGIKWIFRKVLDAAMESIMEFGFDAMTRLNDGEKPGGGSGHSWMFYTLMTGITLIGGVAQALTTKGMAEIALERGWIAKKQIDNPNSLYNIFVTNVEIICKSIQALQWLMMLPVLDAYTPYFDIPYI